MTKGKCHSRGARCNILKASERNARRKARQKAKSYNTHDYDKPVGSEPVEA